MAGVGAAAGVGGRSEEAREKAYTLGKSYDTTSGKIVIMTSRSKDDLQSPTYPPRSIPDLRSIPDQTATAVKIIPVDTEDEMSDPMPAAITKPAKGAPPPVSAKPAWRPPPLESIDGSGKSSSEADGAVAGAVGDAEKTELRLLGDRMSPLLRSPLRSPHMSPTPDLARRSPYLARASPTSKVVVLTPALNYYPQCLTK